jgi:hypothetical protein
MFKDVSPSGIVEVGIGDTFGLLISNATNGEYLLVLQL